MIQATFLNLHRIVHRNRLLGVLEEMLKSKATCHLVKLVLIKTRRVTLRKIQVMINQEPPLNVPCMGQIQNMNWKTVSSFFVNRSKEGRAFCSKKRYCLRCCRPKRHLQKHCRTSVCCDTCILSDHVTILHPEAARDDEGEKRHVTQVKSNCMEVCKTNQNTSKSCAKIILVKGVSRSGTI
jgi:hypothetical protein